MYNYDFVRLPRPAQPGLGFLVRPLGFSNRHSPNPAKELTKTIHQLQRKLKKHLQDNELRRSNPVKQAWIISFLESNIKYLKTRLNQLSHFVA